MDANEFVNQLARLAPSVPQYEQMGISHDTIVSLRRTYFCEPKDRYSDSSAEDVILDLMTNWDTSNIKIGMIELGEAPELCGNHWIIGLVEVDFLVLNCESNEVEVRDHEAFEHLMWRCAANSSAFLGAVVTAKTFLTARGIGDIDFDDMETARLAAQKCGETAGGSKYLDFFLMLFGVE